MLKTLTKFEISFQTKQIGFWVVILIMFALGLLSMSLADIFGANLAGEKIKVNGAQMVAGQIAGWDAAAIFFGAIFVVTAILRDRTYNMLELVHSAPIKTFDMTLSRMIGAFIVILACIFANTIGQFVGQFMPWIDKESIGPIQPLYFLQPMFLFTLFNALFVTAFFTLIAGLTQNRMLVYVSAIALLFISIMTGTITEIDPPRWVEALIDPFANLAYSLDTEYWTPEDRNTRMTPMFGYVGLNRLVWSLISVGILAFVFSKFKRGVIGGKTRKSKTFDASHIGKPVFVSPEFSSLQSLKTIWTQLKFEYLMSVKSIAFIILASLAIVLFAFLIFVTVFLSPQKLVPTSQLMVTIGFGSFIIPMMIIVAFFSGEIVWRDKQAKAVEILHATPVSNSALLTGKWLALIAIVITLLLLGGGVGMIMQMAAGGTAVNIGTYMKFIFLNALPNFIALTVLALFVQTFAPNRIVGMLGAAAIMVGVQFFLGRLPFFHPLINFGGVSPGALSEISPYGNWIRFKWVNAYWGALCILFALLSIWMWRRGLQTGLLHRIKSIGKNTNMVTSGLAALFSLIFLGTGLQIYQAYDKNNYRNSKATELRQVDGEKLFLAETKYPLPKIQSSSIDADVYPSKQEARFAGTFVLKNTTDKEISELYINPATRHPEDILKLEIDGATRKTSGENMEGDSIKDIEDYGYALFEFDPALMPGDETDMRFETFFHAPRLADGSIINKNGTFLNNMWWGTGALPTLGIRDNRLRNKDKRRKYDLPELEKRADRDDMEARQHNFITRSGDYIDFQAKMCTDKGQIPITPGDMIREYEENGRTCRDYKTSRPILNFYAFLSADFEEKTQIWTDPTGKKIPITVYYGKGHDYSIDEMIEGAKHGLEFFTDTYGPYPYNYVRIMEVPFIGFAQAFAGTIPYSEQGFIMDAGDPDNPKRIDNAFRTTLHELGHQWFAHQIVPADTRGYNVLSEGLTSYVTMEAYENAVGWEKAKYALEKSVIEEMMAMQMFDRSTEPPLSLAGEQQYLVYNKSDWVMWGLKHYIGADKVNRALVKLLDDYGSKGPPYPTTAQVVDYLRAAAGPDYQGLITDYWDRITYWELAFADDVTINSNASNGLSITIPIKLDKKISSEEAPKQISVTEIEGEDLDEWVEIGFYEENPKKRFGAGWTKLEKVRLNKTENSVIVDLDETPKFIMLDPRRLLQERNIEDNIKEVSSKQG